MHRGSCLCGKICYEYRGEIDEVSMCHCRQCRKAQGTAFAVAPIRSAGFRITQGAQYLKEFRATPNKARCSARNAVVRYTAPATIVPRPSVCGSVPWTHPYRQASATTLGCPPRRSGSKSPMGCPSFPGLRAEAAVIGGNAYTGRACIATTLIGVL